MATRRLTAAPPSSAAPATVPWRSTASPP